MYLRSQKLNSNSLQNGNKRKADLITNPSENYVPKLKNQKQGSSINESQGYNGLKITYSFLKADAYEAIDCGGAGNCLFLSISSQLPLLPENSFESLRLRACDYLQDNLFTFEPMLTGLINDSNQETYTPKKYIQEKRIDGTYGDEPEIFALSKVLKRSIRVYIPVMFNQILAGFSFRSEYKGEEGFPILLNFIQDQYAPHYQAIKLKSQTKSECQEVKKKNQEQQQETKSEENLLLNTKKIAKRQANQNYGLIKGVNNRYNEILHYFQSGKAQLIPKRIKSPKQKSSWKVKVAKKYQYDEELDRILEKKKVSYENLSNIFPKQELSLENKEYECWYFIPFESEKQIILKLAHNHIIHNGRDRMMINVRTMGYNWANLTNDCQEFIASCFSCPISTMQKIPSITTKQILEEEPKARYQIDTVLLAENLQVQNKKYLITIEDHFSKFLWAATSFDKSAKSVHLALRTFFSLCGEPKILQCDNGKEFINSIVQTFLQEKNIKFVHGQPYHPQSQGLIERANRTIQTALSRKYYELKDEFDLESCLIDILSEYNNNKHSSIKTAPLIAFHLNPNNDKDKPMLAWIKENQKKAFKNKINITKYFPDQKIVVYDGVCKSTNQYLRKSNKKKKKTHAYIIPAIVVLAEASFVKIKIAKDSKIVDGILKEDEEYNITLNLIQAANDKRWISCFL